MRQIFWWSLVLCLGYVLTAASASANDAEGKAAEAVKKLGATDKDDEQAAEPNLDQKIDVYVGQLKRGNVEQRREAVLALRLIGERAKAAAPALAGALWSEDPTLCVDVAEALWQANRDPAAMTALAAALKDTDWRVFQRAAEALDRIGPEAKAAVPALLELLDEGWVWERKYVAWAGTACRSPGCGAGGLGPPACFPPEKAAWLLWRIDKHPVVMPALLKALQDPAHRAGAARTLGRIGLEAKAAVPVLLKLLDEENGTTRIDFKTEGPLTQYREALTYALWRIDQHAAYAPALVLGLKDTNPDMRIYYINALGGMGTDAKAAVPALAEALHDEKSFVGLAAADALGRSGADAAVPALLVALKGNRGRLRVAAAEALWQINQHPAAQPALVEALTDQADYANVYADSALRRMGAIPKAATPTLADVPALVEVVRNPKESGYPRIVAANKRWQINRHPAAVPSLLEVLKDQNVSMRSCAAEALWQINRHPAAVPTLAQALHNSDNWVGSGAARILGRIGAEAQAAVAALTEAHQEVEEEIDPEAAKKSGVAILSPALADSDLQEKLDVYLGRLKHGTVEQRREAVQALGHIGERAKAVVPFLTESLKAEEYAIRNMAAEALWRLQQDPAAVDVAIAHLIADLKSEVRRSDAADILGRFGVRAKAAVPALVEALNNDANIHHRHRAALTLWQINKHPNSIPTLVKALKDSESGPRASAARALGEIGADANSAVPALLEALKDKPWTDWDNNAFHIPVAMALWQIDEHPAAVPALIECMKDSTQGDGRRRSEAAGSFCTLLGAFDAALPFEHRPAVVAGFGEAAVPALVEMLKDERPDVRWNAIGVLSAIGPEAKAAVPALIEAVRPQTGPLVAPPGAPKGYLGLASVSAGIHGEPYVERVYPGSPAAKAGLKLFDVFIGVNDTQIINIKELREALKKLALQPGDTVTFAIDRGKGPTRIAVTAREWPGPDERVPTPGFGDSRVGAARLLWKLDKHPAVVPALAEMLKDMEAGPGAAAALRDIGADAKPAIPALIDALKGENRSTRVPAAWTLARLGAEAEAIPALIEALQDKDVSVSSYAAQTLATVARKTEAVPPLVKALQDKDALVRISAAASLGKVASKTEAVPALVKALKDENSSVRYSAAASLGNIKNDPVVVARLLESLTDEQVRLPAAAALWRINRHPAAVPALVEDSKSRGGGFFDLSNIGLEGKAAVAALTDALHDEDEGVRNSAAQWLKKIEPEGAKQAGEDKRL